MSVEETKFYTLEEIRKNNGENGARTWIIVKDIVYDVTDYMEDHPGGADLIAEWAGRDATKEFENAGHSGDAKKEQKKLKIGELAEEDRKKKGDKKNGVTKKAESGPKVVENKNEQQIRRSCMAVVTCGLCG